MYWNVRFFKYLQEGKVWIQNELVERKFVQVPTGRESDQMEQDSKENVKKSLSAKFRVPTGREKVNK